MIKEAAIQRKSDGKIWTGRRHSNCIHTIVKETGIKTVDGKRFTQGFVTVEGKFVDRTEAWYIALANNQIKDIEDPYGYDYSNPLVKPTLFSEDLY